jgi:prepilin-type N-terminal cleavage/methylation domain-containing protein
MIHLQALPSGGPGSRGFSLIELLIALAIVTLLAGALAGVAAPARAVFDRVPAELDLQQRGRMAIDVISKELRSAGRSVPAMNELGSFADIVPAFALSDPDESGEVFSTLTVTTPALNGAQGILEADQAGAFTALTLRTTSCPNVIEVCGFAAGTTAIITDGAGHHDLFEVASTGVGVRTLTPERALSQAYPAGSVVVEIAQHTFSLARQADGSFSLIRETAAGAIQPVVDGVASLAFHASEHQVEVAVSVKAATESLRRVLQDRVFRTSVHLRNVP